MLGDDRDAGSWISPTDASLTRTREVGWLRPPSICPPAHLAAFLSGKNLSSKLLHVNSLEASSFEFLE